MDHKKRLFDNLPHVFFLLFLGSIFCFLMGALIWNQDSSSLRLFLVFGGLLGMILNGIGFTFISLFKIYVYRPQGKNNFC